MHFNRNDISSYSVVFCVEKCVSTQVWIVCKIGRYTMHILTENASYFQLITLRDEWSSRRQCVAESDIPNNHTALSM